MGVYKDLGRKTVVSPRSSLQGKSLSEGTGGVDFVRDEGE